MSRVLGLDIGGTLSRARLATGPDPADVVAESEAPSASLTAAGLAQAERSVEALLVGVGLASVGAGSAPGTHGSAPGTHGSAPGTHGSAPGTHGSAPGTHGSAPGTHGSAPGTHGSAPGTEVDAICVGSAGSGSPEAVEWLLGRLGPLCRGGPGAIEIVNDSLLALAAAGLDEGVAVICGTGSTAVGVRGERRERAGGWGYMLGDEGSGFWIVREAIRELCRRHDAHEPPGPLGAIVLPAAGAEEVLGLIQLWHAEAVPAQWAAIAPAVLDCGDPSSSVILDGAAGALAGLGASVRARLGWPDGRAVPIVLAGGLVTNHERLQAATRSAIERTLPSAEVSVVSRPPVAGAVRLALRLARASSPG